MQNDMKSKKKKEKQYILMNSKLENEKWHTLKTVRRNQNKRVYRK